MSQSFIKIKKDSVIISELPIGMWTDDYKQYLETLLENKNKYMEVVYIDKENFGEDNWSKSYRTGVPTTVQINTVSEFFDKDFNKSLLMKKIMSIMVLVIQILATIKQIPSMQLMIKILKIIQVIFDIILIFPQKLKSVVN